MKTKCDKERKQKRIDNRKKIGEKVKRDKKQENAKEEKINEKVRRDRKIIK